MLFRNPFLLLFCLLFQQIIYAQPVNDNCSGAVSVSVSSAGTCDNAVQGTTIAATNSGLNTCWGESDDDVWYQFVATATSHRVRVTGSSLGDPVLEVFGGTCTSLVSLDCVDDGSGSSEQVVLSGLTVGNTYLVRVYSWSGGSGNGTFSLCVQPPPPPPANDNCAAAAELIANADLTCTTSVTGTTESATLSLAGCSGTADDDVWYYFTAISSRHLLVLPNYSSVIGFSSPVIEVFAGNCNALTSIGCSGSSNVLFLENLVAGNVYRARVYTYDQGASMTFTLCLRTPPPPPSNDECAAAINLPVNGVDCLTSVAGSTAGATGEEFGCTGYSDDDVWYSFVATNTSHVVTLSNTAPVTNLDGYDMVIEAFSGNCNNLTSIKCSDPDQMILNGLTIGNTYYVRAYSYYYASYINFSICVTTPAQGPVNDACSGAVTLIASSNTQCANPVNSTTEGAYNSTVPGCTGSAEDDVWFQFTAVSGTHIITVDGGTIVSPVIEILQGNCNNPVSVYCKGASFSGDNTVTVDGFAVGQSYFVRVYSASSAVSDEGTFSICITTGNAPLVNDGCQNAIVVPVNASTDCTTTVAGNNTGAIASLVNDCSGTADDDVWYKFTATSAVHVITVSPGSAYDLVVQLFGGNCGAPVELDCVDNTISSDETTTVNNLLPGQDYYIRVYSYDLGFGSGTFSVCVGTLAAPSNDGCNTAMAMTVTPTCTNPIAQNSTLANPSGITSNCFGTPDDDLWYSFVATSPQHSIIVDGGFDIDAVIEVFSGGCNGSFFGCRDNSLSGVETYALTGLTTGNTYFFRVYDYYSGGGLFTVCVTGVTSGSDVLPAGSADIKVYPNPATSFFTIEVPESQTVKNITVMSAQSVVCLEKVNPKNVENLNVDGLPAGVYLVRIQTETGMYFSSVVKQ